ncbi:MAG: valine--tRNA ligase, partial [Bacteroidales bacterium]|nr:valine--tRNA ligase [Bacteroidales bacterium]
CAFDPASITQVDEIKEVIMSVRTLRQSKKISNKEALALYVHGPFNASLAPLITKLAFISQVHVEPAPANLSGSSFRVGTTEFFVPLGALADSEAERKKLLDELAYYEGFVASVRNKLSNSAFVQNAPQKVVEMERKKERDSLAKIDIILGQLKSLGSPS